MKLRKGISKVIDFPEIDDDLTRRAKLKSDLLQQKQERMKARELERQKMKDDSKTFYSKLKVCKVTSLPR